MAAYFKPTSLTAAVEALSDGSWTLLAGGTDVFPAKAGEAAWGRQRDDAVIDLSGLSELAGISRDAAGIRIGAGVTWSDLLAADLPADFAALRAAAREVGGRQIQNRGTLVGNICNASPAADGVPPLLCLEAEVELRSRLGRRQLPLQDFLLGNRQTARRPDELVSAILIPPIEAPGASRFLKLGARHYLVISIVMVAARLRRDAAGRVAAAQVAVGACSPVAQRLPELEAALLGRPLDGGLAELVEPSHVADLSPLDDLRASGTYRREAALVLLRRALASLAAEPWEQAA